MSFIQKLIKAILPQRWAEAIEADSRLWMVRCHCGFAKSLWEMGGVRGKAAGQVHWYMKCPQCGQRSWLKVTREEPAKSASSKI